MVPHQYCDTNIFLNTVSQFKNWAFITRYPKDKCPQLRVMRSTDVPTQHISGISCIVMLNSGSCCQYRGLPLPQSQQSRLQPRMVNLYTKEGVESLHILLYTSINVCIVNAQQIKFNTVSGQSPESQCGQRSNTVKVLTCSRSCDY